MSVMRKCHKIVVASSFMFCGRRQKARAEWMKRNYLMEWSIITGHRFVFVSLSNPKKILNYMEWIEKYSWITWSAFVYFPIMTCAHPPFTRIEAGNEKSRKFKTFKLRLPPRHRRTRASTSVQQTVTWHMERSKSELMLMQLSSIHFVKVSKS